MWSQRIAGGAIRPSENQRGEAKRRSITAANRSVPKSFVPEDSLGVSQIVGVKPKAGRVGEYELCSVGPVLRPVRFVFGPEGVRVAGESERQEVFLHHDL